MDDFDQWKSGGNCKFCRRAGYCKKQCKANQRYMIGVMASVIAETKMGRMLKAVSMVAGDEYGQEAVETPNDVLRELGNNP